MALVCTSFTSCKAQRNGFESKSAHDFSLLAAGSGSAFTPSLLAPEAGTRSFEREGARCGETVSDGDEMYDCEGRYVRCAPGSGSAPTKLPTGQIWLRCTNKHCAKAQKFFGLAT